MPIMNTVIAGGGTTPTGSISITNNGTYDVTDKAEAVVDVPTTAPALYREFQLDGTGMLIPNTTTTHIMDFTGMTDVSNYALVRAYYGNTAISGAVDMSDLITISGSNACLEMFSGCTGITSANLSALTTISGNNACNYMFSACTGLTSVDLSSVTTIGATQGCLSMFSGCAYITNANLSSLTTINGISACKTMFSGCKLLTSMNLPSLTTVIGGNCVDAMFKDCSQLTSVSMDNLNTINTSLGNSYSPMFYNCVKLESVSLGGLTSSTFATKVNLLQYLFSSTTGSNAPNGCTVHFPSNLDPSNPDRTFDASTLSGYPTFGGDANYIHVAFDLPATE